MLLSTGAVASSSSAPQPPMMETFRVAFLNVYLGLSAQTHRDAVNRHISRVQPSILGLSEINNSDKTYVQTTMASLHGLPNVVVHPSTGNLQTAFMTSYPIVNSGIIESTSPANEFRRNPIWAELTVGSKTLLVISVHTESWCYNGPCANVAKPELEFPRAIEWIRMKEFVESRTVDGVIVMGDMNDDDTSPQTASFASEPAGVFAGFQLGADITFPVQHSTYPDYQCSQAGLTALKSTDTDGDRNTIWSDGEGGPNSAFPTAVKLDYICHSSGVTVTGDEVLSSEVADQTAGLPKYGAVLPAGDSFVASDHKMPFADASI